jgi:CRISPR-associated protein Cmr1
MPTLTVRLKTITPLFLGGAEPNDFAELRPPAIKGLLRFWYRAVNPNYRNRTEEARIFGGTGATEGQSTFRLQLESPIQEKMGWDLERYQRAPFQKGGSQGAPPKNGLLYLGFPLRLGGNDRKAIPPGTSFSVKIRFSTTPTEEIRKAVLSSWWLLGHFGGLGTRSRRGFGTVALQGWECEGQEIKDLPIAHKAESPKDWITKVQTAVNTMRSWFGEFPDDKIDHTTIARETRLYLSIQGFKDDQSAKAWEWALWRLGMDMQTFRQKRPPDYSDVKAHLVRCGIAAARTGRTPPQAPPVVNPQFLSPQRAAFGLPLTFRYRSLSGFPSTTTFRPALHERSASPILLRVVEIQGCAHPLVIWLRAPLPGSDGGVVEEKGRRVVLNPPSGQILEDFCSYLKNQGFMEVLL